MQPPVLRTSNLVSKEAQNSLEGSNLVLKEEPSLSHLSMPTHMNGTGTSQEPVGLEVKLFATAFLVLFYPIAMSCVLHAKPSVQYWYGSGSFIVAVSVTLWVVLCKVALRYGKLPRSAAFMCYVVLPALVLCVHGTIQTTIIVEYASMLTGTDCNTFAEKAALQRAWDAASAFKQGCAVILASESGVSFSEEATSLVNIAECSGYQEAMKGHHAEWTYLEHIEKKYTCGGWCYADLPIWLPDENRRDSCSAAATLVMTGSITTQGHQISAYSLMVLCVSTAILILAPKQVGAW